MTGTVVSKFALSQNLEPKRLRNTDLDYLKKCQISIILYFKGDNGAGDPVAEIHPLAVGVNLDFGSGLMITIVFILLL